MRVNRMEYISATFVLKWDDLSSMHDKLLKMSADVEITSKCSDGTSREFSSIDEFKNFPNSNRCRINSLNLTGRTRDYKNRVSINFDSTGLKNISILVDVIDDDLAYKLFDNSKDAVESLKPWYNPIAKLDFTNVVFFAVFVYIISRIFKHVAKNNIEVSSFILSGFDDFPYLYAFSLYVSVFMVGHLINWAKSFAFPKGVFAIGHGLKRHDNLEIVRQVVIVGFFMSILATLATSWY